MWRLRLNGLFFGVAFGGVGVKFCGVGAVTDMAANDRVVKQPYFKNATRYSTFYIVQCGTKCPS